MPYPHWGAAGAWWPVIPLFWALFWGTLVVLVLRVRKQGRGPFAWARHMGAGAGAPASPTAPAEAILAERYARGEMSDDEYFQRLSVLKGGAT
ncbi:SHOCT domain-containing protein [Sphaerisporangium aureirubrum]|uniref:SHOCT domain-containing protein n=1 Tax=Sphaerisporangium aureirubrum TaxID=1544736 RepID=A0ABW1NUT5_9ACTN